MSEIDKKIRELNYEPNDVLVYNGETITKYIPKEGKFEEDRFSVTTRVKRSIGDKFFDISVVTSSLDRIYLGSILLANQKLMENLPIEVACEKKALTFRVNNLPGLTSDEAIATIENPRASSVIGKIQDISQLWLDKYSDENTNTTILDYKESMVYSEAQLMTEFGLEIGRISGKLNFDFNNNENKQIYLCRLKQIYYSATMDAPNEPSDLISDNVSWDELVRKGVNDKNPPVYVSNIDFGREIYIKFETKETSKNVKNAFSALVKGVDINNNTEYKEIIKNSTFSLLIIGGNIEEIKGEGLEALTDISKIINNGLKFSKASPAFPISYTTTFLKNNEIAVTRTRTDYIETTTTIFRRGELILSHFGAYVARFYVNWEEFNFDSNGNEIVEKKTWENNGRQVTAGYRESIEFKANTRNIEIKAQGATGLIWEPWRTSLNRAGLPLLKHRIVVLRGTTLNQTASMDPND